MPGIGAAWISDKMGTISAKQVRPIGICHPALAPARCSQGVEQGPRPLIPARIGPLRAGRASCKGQPALHFSPSHCCQACQDGSPQLQLRADGALFKG